MWTITDRRPFAVVLGALVALAWLTLWLWGQSPYGRLLSHHQLDDVRGGGALVAVFVVGWLVMIVAMMLPTSLPLVLVFHRITSARRDQPWLVGLLLAGYLGTWTLCGLGIYLGDWALHAAVASSAWLQLHAWAIGVATLLLAGAYQFTPLKYHCLDRCRSPLHFVVQHWHGRRERLQALRLGADHGLYCLGCCWSLMLVMFGVGVGNLGWMLLLAAVMAAEKNLPRGRRLSAPLGVVLLACGLLLLAGSVAAGG